MSTTTTIAIHRTPAWVAAQRLATGTNTPDYIRVEVVPAELSEASRAIILTDGRGAYPSSMEAIYYDRDYSLSPCPYSSHGRKYIVIDSDSPSVAEIDAAILATAASIEADRLESQRQKSEAEAEARRLAAEWAARPLTERAGADGVRYCTDGAVALSLTGVLTYDPDTLRAHEPAAWASAVAESERLAAKRKAAAEAVKKAQLEKLAAWTSEHGSELARLRLEDGYDCWVSQAREDYADEIVGAIRVETGLPEYREIPGDYDSEPRKCPTADEIKTFRAAKAAAKKHEGVTAELVRVTYTDDYGEKTSRTEIVMTIPVPGAGDIERYLMI